MDHHITLKLSTKKYKDSTKLDLKKSENFARLGSTIDIRSPKLAVNSRSVPDVYLNTTCNDYKFAPLSPVSPRVKNIDADMEALTLSRNDNPFIQQKLEKLSASGDLLSNSSLTLNISQNVDGNAEFEQSLISIDGDDISETDTNVHQYLIRSPPPQFPQKFSHFIFPVPGSPIGSLSLRTPGCNSPLKIFQKAASKSEDYADKSSLKAIEANCFHRNSIAMGETCCRSLGQRRESESFFLNTATDQNTSDEEAICHSRNDQQTTKSRSSLGSNIDLTFADDYHSLSDRGSANFSTSREALITDLNIS
ncbi:uncharacterized protein B4U79_01849 [Dinothrombium tinctorium]|uniref:Uncharacterized protein n=1 Tax=Dinothrombium tinctorium TaxID=1965070 RepID=A0A443RE87_9ACAR|nr:uncharacterized protein B4U79_01849 [Dinothrombium tinctorium]